MKCPKCNEEIADGVKFCTKCGANIEEAKIDKTEKNPSVKEEKPKKKNNKKKIALVIAIIIVLLAGGAGAGIWLYLSNQEDQKEEKVLEWGDVYLEILNDDKKLENMEEMKIGLIDLDQDKIPELIVQGINSAKERIATVYKINEQNKVDTLNIMMNEDFSFKLVYDLKVDKYVWYAVAKETAESPEVYDLNIESKKYKQELLDRDYKNDLVIVDTNQSKMIDFSKELSKDERKEKFNEAKDEYVDTEEMITDEVEEKVELAKAIRDIKKIDESKEIVYSAVSKKIGNAIYEYPCININSEEIKAINSEIEKEYGFSSTMTQNNYFDIIGPETEEISYKYTINKNVLSVIAWKGGNENIWADAYIVDLKTSKKLTAEELINQYGFKKNDVITKATEAVNNEFNTIIQKEKTAIGSGWENLYGEKTVDEWKLEIAPYIEKLKVFVNDKNELCILGQYQHGGGQWSCCQTVVINITNGYKLSELTFKDGTSFEHYVVNYQQPENTTTPSTSPSSTNSSNSSNSVSNITFGTSSIVVPEGTYTRGTNGTLTITNSKPGQFDFSIECTYMTQAGYPNLGMIDGTAKATSNGNFAYIERKSNGAYEDYNIIFYIADGETITIDEEYEGYTSPYCGHNVTLEGSFTK